MVSFLIVFLSSVAVMSFTRNRSKITLREGAYGLASLIREARELSLSSRVIKNSTVTSFGVVLQRGSERALLFADTYPSSTGGDNKYTAGKDVVLRWYNLPSQLKISSLPSSSVTIVFRAPLSLASISLGSSGADQVNIGLSHGTSGEQILLRVNKVGLVYVQEL